MKETLPLLLLAGVPGVGKTTIASCLDDSVVVATDDFYLSTGDPRLPYMGSLPDWDSKESLELNSLRDALELLLRGEEATIPRYDMRHSRRDGERRVSPQGARAIVAEGVYAFELQPAGAERLTRVLITAPLSHILWRRLRRDLREGRYHLSDAPRQTLHFLRRYRKYNADQSRHADHVLRHTSDARATAEKIRRLAGYWDR
jgi:uridine kinase